MVGSFDRLTAGIVCHITKEFVKKIFQQIVSFLYEMILLSSLFISKYQKSRLVFINEHIVWANENLVRTFLSDEKVGLI